jgi:cytochrome oxidase assembly protein ShyY1
VFSLVRQPRWLAFLAITVGLCVLFWWLGLWQWHRHEDRSARNDAVEAAQQAPEQPLADLMPDPSNLPTGTEHRLTTASGQYLTDAQVLQRNPSGRAGYAVLTPLELDTGGTVIVNRGFVPPSTTNPNTPSDLEGLVPASGPVELVMRVRAPQDTTDRTAPTGQVYDIDPRDYPAPLPGPVYVAYGDLVDQTPDDGSDLERPEAADLGMGPHLFYAFQWWLFIPIAVIGLLLLMRREARHDQQQADTPAPDGAQDAEEPTRPG